jgi:starvation-inducible outer membrane lipoprotein
LPTDWLPNSSSIPGQTEQNKKTVEKHNHLAKAVPAIGDNARFGGHVVRANGAFERVAWTKRVQQKKGGKKKKKWQNM